MSKIHYEDILKPRVDMEREWGILKMDCSVVTSAFNNSASNAGTYVSKGSMYMIVLPPPPSTTKYAGHVNVHKGVEKGV